MSRVRARGGGRGAGMLSLGALPFLRALAPRLERRAKGGSENENKKIKRKELEKASLSSCT